MTNGYFKRVSEQTATRFWINNVTRDQAKWALDAGAIGCTQNPSYAWKMLTGPDAEHAKELMREIMAKEKDDTWVEVCLQRELVGEVAKEFLPLYEASGKKHGYVSIQGDPFHEDVETIVNCARFNREIAPNIMAKVPVTPEGLAAIRILAAEGVPINATECMAVRQVIDACEAYVDATRDLKDPAPMYFSLITGIYDQYLAGLVKKEGIDVSPDALWQAGMSIAKKVHEIVKQRKYPCGFIGGGARGLHHFTEMVGADANITINWVGTADKLLELDQPVVSRFFQPTPFLVEDELVEKLEDYRKAYFINAIEPSEYEDFGPVVLFRSSFEDSWKKTLDLIAAERAKG